EEIEPTEKGLAIRLKARRKGDEPVGPNLEVTVRGNFEVTGWYEIVQADKPNEGGGVGVELRIATPPNEAISFTRVLTREGSETIGCRRETTVNGKRVFQSSVFPAETKSGRLRITRQGSEAILWASEGGAEDFKELCRYELGTEDLQAVRFAAHS